MHVCISSSYFYPHPLYSLSFLPVLPPSHSSVSHIDALLFCLWSIEFNSLSICVTTGMKLSSEDQWAYQ